MELKTAISLILAPATFGREFADARAETPVQLGLRYSADTGINVIERYVIKVVETAEDRNLPELGHSRQHTELDMALHRLENRVEPMELVSVKLKKLRFVDCR